MPRIDKLYTLEVGVEQFLNACSPLELKEVEMAILSPRFQNRMKGGDPALNRPELSPDRVKGDGEWRKQVWLRDAEG